MSHNNQKKIAVINDLSGFGRCSLAVSMPIISYMGIQCCPVPTSIFSNHTGFPEFFFDDYTEHMDDYISMWHKLGLKFEGITSGFLGSKEQIETVIRFVEQFCSGRTKEMGWKKKELCEMAEALFAQGPGKVVITGIPQGEFIANYVMEKGKEPRLLRTHKAGTERSGTGDVFASVIAADAVNGVAFDRSVKKASNFVKKCILKSMELGIPQTDGVCFEEILHSLKRD